MAKEFSRIGLQVPSKDLLYKIGIAFRSMRVRSLALYGLCHFDSFWAVKYPPQNHAEACPVGHLQRIILKLVAENQGGFAAIADAAFLQDLI